jgi:hypothetical protein
MYIIKEIYFTDRCQTSMGAACHPSKITPILVRSSPAVANTMARVISPELGVYL